MCNICNADKVLTVSIAAYNMEPYIRQTLESLIDERIIEDLEVIVIDDGGTDRTLEIAKEYAEKYPNSIFPVHKENGGYGTTVNYSVAHARGKYFKLLDGDDWFDIKGFVELVKYLRDTDIDVIFTSMRQGPDSKNLKRVNINWMPLYKRTLLSELGPVSPLLMWTMTFKTELIRKEWIDLPSESFYTDVLFTQYPLANAIDAIYLDSVVYCYRTNRNGNSTNRISMAKHYIEYMRILSGRAEFYEQKKRQNNPNIDILLSGSGQAYRSAIKGLLYNPVSREVLKEFIRCENKLKEKSIDIFYESEKHGKTGRFLWLARRTNYYLYWILPLLYVLKE